MVRETRVTHEFPPHSGTGTGTGTGSGNGYEDDAASRARSAARTLLLSAVP